MNMIYRKYLVAFTALVLMTAFAGLSTAQYEDVIIDDEGDVQYFAPGEWLPTEVEKPDADISRVELNTVGGTISVSLTVVGEILELDEGIEFVYNIYLLDQENRLYWIQYDGRHTVLAVEGNEYETEVTGIGTDTLTVSFSAVDIGEPATLDLRDAEIMLWIEDEEGEVHQYRDTATAEEDEEEGEFIPENVVLDIEPTSGPTPLDVVISISAENTGDGYGELVLTIDGDVHTTMPLEAEESDSDSFTYTFFEEGTWIVGFGDEFETVVVDDTLEEDENGETPPEDDDDETPPEDDENGDDDDDDAPGFALVLLTVSLIIAVLIHKKKDEPTTQ